MPENPLTTSVSCLKKFNSEKRTEQTHGYLNKAARTVYLQNIIEYSWCGLLLPFNLSALIKLSKQV